jgi:tetratricopeptide (TPR) repeat protein
MLVRNLTKDRRGEGTALYNLGIAYAALGHYPKAMDYKQQGLKILTFL